ncbi:hypothetical protein [Neobacillus soli]|uniref:hypothetical protein n=1 Tax=Neobacillus soli TaxID=220688 RepID=UPI0008261D1E|nr:hypothetical protein [Neobacillus soli]
MGLMIQRLKERSKKYFLILIAVPLFLGVIGWLLPVGKEASSYTTEATITLGSYNNPSLNDPKRVITLLTNAPFYEENLAMLWEEKHEEITTKLQVTAGADYMINLSYTDHPGQSAVEVINKISDAFIAMDRERFQKKQTIIQESIEALKDEKVAPEAMVDQQRFLYELKTAQNDIKPAAVLKSANKEAIETANRAFNSKERAVLGILLGITISFLWIVFPEIVRKQSF